MAEGSAAPPAVSAASNRSGVLALAAYRRSPPETAQTARATPARMASRMSISGSPGRPGAQAAQDHVHLAADTETGQPVERRQRRDQQGQRPTEDRDAEQKCPRGRQQ